MVEDEVNTKVPTDKRVGKQLRKLYAGIAAVRTGDIGDGAQLLYEIIKDDPENETAWLWLSYCFENTYQKKYCLSKVLAINPDNQKAHEDILRFNQTPKPSINKISFPPSEINKINPILLPQQQPAPVSVQIKPPTSINNASINVPSSNNPKKTAHVVELVKQIEPRIYLWIATILVLLGVGTFMYIHFSTNVINPKIVVDPVATVVNYQQITYKVWCDSCTDVQFISYVPTSGNILDIINLWLIKVPWQSTIQGVNGRQAIVKASNTMGGTIHCSISINGKEVTNAVSKSEADCVANINAK